MLDVSMMHSSIWCSTLIRPCVVVKASVSLPMAQQVLLYLFLTYKALLRGKKVVYVDPRYTSQKCSVCGYVYRGNRSKKHQSDFCCRKCGFQIHADLNASRNIKNNYIAMLGSASHSRLLSISQTPQLELETVLS